MSLENVGPDHVLDFRAGTGIGVEADRQEMRHDFVIGFIGGCGREDAEEPRFPALKGRAESSRTSLSSACRAVSPDSIFPPGNMKQSVPRLRTSRSSPAAFCTNAAATTIRAVML
jgi:hypothetical protein